MSRTGIGEWSDKALAGQQAAARALSAENYVRLRSMAYTMADVTGKGGAGSAKYAKMADEFADGYAEMTRYVCKSGRMDEASSESVRAYLNDGITFSQAESLDNGLRRGILDGMPTRMRIAFALSDAKAGNPLREGEMRSWIRDETKARLSEREVDLKSADAMMRKASEIEKSRASMGLTGDEPGIDAATARVLDYGKPIALMQAEARNVAASARRNFHDYHEWMSDVLLQNPDVFDYRFISDTTSYIEHETTRQDAEYPQMETASKMRDLCDVDLSLHADKYRGEYSKNRPEPSFDPHSIAVTTASWTFADIDDDVPDFDGDKMQGGDFGE